MAKWQNGKVAKWQSGNVAEWQHVRVGAFLICDISD
jgi:hypothetical protein